MQKVEAPCFQLCTPDDFPNWIDDSAIWACEIYGKSWFYDYESNTYNSEQYIHKPEIRRKSLESIKRAIRCLKALSLRDCWLNLDKRINAGSLAESQTWLVNAILTSNLPPQSKLKTKTEAEQWKRQCVNSIAKTIRLLSEMPDNYNEFHKHFHGIRRQLYNSYDPSYLHDKENTRCNVMNNRLFDSPKDILRDTLEALDKTEFSPHFSGSHINGEYGERQYFVRFLTNTVLLKTGRKNRKLVSEITSAAFECNFSEREVIRLTKNLPTDNTQSYTKTSSHMISDQYISMICKDSRIARANWNTLRKNSNLY